jgi:superfamily II DNA or RNA helicase
MHQAAERYRLRFAESIGKGVDSPEVSEALEGAVGRFGDGSTTIGSRLTVATFQTVKSKLETEEGQRLLQSTRGLMIDECHTLPSTSYYKVSMGFNRARYRVGFSGTPLDRGDKRSILAVASLGPVIHKVASADLVELGVLARPEIRMVKISQDIWKPTYQGLYGEAVVRSTIRNRTIAEIASQLAKRPAVVFFKELRHGQRLAEALERRGLNVALVEGRTKVTSRQSIGQSLARGDLDVVVSSVVWQEGIDIPELESVIVAAGGKSIIAALQRAGRGMRANADKTTFQLWDVYDEGSEILERHSKARRKAYEREGFRVELVDLPGHL